MGEGGLKYFIFPFCTNGPSLCKTFSIYLLSVRYFVLLCELVLWYYVFCSVCFNFEMFFIVMYSRLSITRTSKTRNPQYLKLFSIPLEKHVQVEEKTMNN